MMHTWKVPHLAKGLLTYVPAVNRWRAHTGATGGTDSVRYCYAVWLRHLVTLSAYGFHLPGARVAELGPGDSVGTGIAALLSGATAYTGIDVVRYAAKDDAPRFVQTLAEMFASREPIPDHNEFPRVRPRLADYSFPSRLIEAEGVPERAARLVRALTAGDGDVFRYEAPMTSVNAVAPGSLDLIMSQAVLQYVESLPQAYASMYAWLKPGGFCSHATGFGANDLSPFWNGHWAYSDTEWQLVRGAREYLLNREPLSTHLSLARSVGFSVLHCDVEYDHSGLPIERLDPRFQALDRDDLSARGVMLVLRK